MKTKSITQKIAEAREDMERQAHEAALRADALNHETIKDVYAALPAYARKRTYISAGIFGNLHMTLSVDDLNSFKDKRLLKVLDVFSGDDWETETRDYTGSRPNRDFTFRKELRTPHNYGSVHYKWLKKRGHTFDSTFELSVYVCAYVKEDSPSCRVVVTGFEEEVVRKEIKKIVCA
jgi:hypothetical protein